MKKYKQTDLMSMQLEEVHADGSVSNTLLIKKSGNWYKGADLVDLSGENVTLLDERAYKAEQEAIAAKQANKMSGIPHGGVNVSLTESNQNGLAAVMQGENLAVEFGGSIFPLNFSVETANGFELVSFATIAEFKAFALLFISARQAFFV